MIPSRGMLLVKPIETAETLPGGKILLTEGTRQDLTSHQMEVSAIGAPWICDNEECWRAHQVDGEYVVHPCEAMVGDWVLVAHRSLSETDTDNVFICAQDAVIARLEA